MIAELALRLAFWILIIGVIGMRIYFSLQVRKAGERLMPDQQAIQQEGKGMFAARVVMFFLLIGWSVCHQPHLVRFSFHPVAGLATLVWFHPRSHQPGILDLDSSGIREGMVTSAPITGGTSSGDRWSLQAYSPPAIHCHDGLWYRPRPVDCQLGVPGPGCVDQPRSDRTCAQGGANDARRVWGPVFSLYETHR